MRAASFGRMVYVVTVMLAGCGDHHEVEGGPTGATCPNGSTLTYDTFGMSFMEQYCTSCHASSRAGEARNGAPSDHNFDTLVGVRDNADHIEELAAAGPGAVNTIMPPSEYEAQPSEVDRRLLGEWLACGAP